MSCAAKEIPRRSPSVNPSSPLTVREFPSLEERGEAAWFGSMWKEKRLGDGLFITAFDASLPREFTLEFAKSNPLIDFGFFLEGSFVNRIDSLSDKRLELQNRAGEFGLGYVPEMAGSLYMPADRKLRIMHLHVMPSTLMAMLGQDVGRVSPRLRGIMEDGNAEAFVHQRRQSPLIQGVANELFYSVRNDAGIRLYVEGKVCELLALVLTGVGSDCAGNALSPRQRETLHAIRDELEARYAEPPSLSEISAKFHTPVASIQAGFKTLFGTSVFAFVKEYRLQRARSLFAEGDMNVSEVAWDIGYTNLSHFSSAYRKRFGVLPKAYLQSVREHLHTPDRLAE